ncbi:MAG: hypothetical protein ABI680_00330, partial [Chthoniobacteraceae bacterium]
RTGEYLHHGRGDPTVEELLRTRRLMRATLRDQLTSRYLAWGVIAAVIAAVWEFTRWVEVSLQEQAAAAVTTASGFTALFTGLFIWLRSWLGKFDEQEKGGGWWKKAGRLVKTHAPAVAAMAGALSLVVSCALLLRSFGLGRTDGGMAADDAEIWRSVIRLATVSALIILIALKIFDPAYFGLHDFYRSRIARAFLGAAFVGGARWEEQTRAGHEIPDRLAHEAAARRALATKKREQAAAADPDHSDRDREILRQRAKELEGLAGRLDDLHRRLNARARSTPSARDNRYTVERPQDDVALCDLPAARPAGIAPELAALRLRPIHLICCAANHLAGDALPNLYRGARSAVLSQRGISLGDETCAPRRTDPPLMLSAALTASAAAFNSQMGERSNRLGPASCFLMSAFNLRLGLWVQNPAAVRAAHDRLVFDTFCLRQDRRKEATPWWRHPLRSLAIRWGDLCFRVSRQCHDHRWIRAFLALPGKVFFRELAGDSSCLPDDRSPQIHLSDGGHFENLGLYELIRRHCRYIIVSDAGQDPEVALDDLGNAIRRVREDFGVEIEINLDPIRPNAQLISRQHLVIGTIHYDGLSGSDRGTLVYLKPSLTGDEPGDIQQYRTRNRIFPHEPTSDQFFAEAQWESYRQLGEHVGRTAFAFLDHMDKNLRRQSETIFWRARHVWSTLPDDFSEHFQTLTAEVRELDEDIRENAPAQMRAEFFPEIGALTSAPKPRATVKSNTADESLTLFFLMRAIHLMENAWFTLKLGRHLSHPMNDGWLNYFDRWALAPSFRRWWPILSALYSIDFRDFIKTRYGLRLRDPAARASDHDAVADARAGDSTKSMPLLELRTGTPRSRIREGHAWKMRRIRRGEPTLPSSAKVFEYLLHLESADPRWATPLQIGVVMVNFKVVSQSSSMGGQPRTSDVAVASWESSEFYVPEPLTGAGIYSRFLDRLLSYLAEHRHENLPIARVEVDLGGKREDDASRQIRLRMLDFYKSRQFSVAPQAAENEAGHLRVIYQFPEQPETRPAPAPTVKSKPPRKRSLR